MQVSVETTSGLERRLMVGVPAERVDSQVDAKLSEARKNVRLDGFRPGKVPMKVMRQRFGESVRMEVLGDVMNESFYQAIKEQNLVPAGQPQIEPKSIEAGKDIEFIATFEVFPEIEPKSYAGIKVEQPEAAISDDDVQNMVQRLREQRATLEEVDRAAAEGDTVVIDYEGRKDGEVFEGGTAEDSSLELGSGSMIPGFEDGIVGLKAGDEKTLSLSFPEDYHAEELKGAAVEFSVKVKAVKVSQLPELNDELFAQFGVEDGGEEAFLEEVRRNMQRELDSAVKNRVKSQIMDALAGSHDDLQVPAALVSQEIDALRQQSMQQFGGLPEGLDLKSILPDEMFSEQADKRVRLGLILNAYIEQNDVKADDDKIRETIDEMSAGYQDKEQFAAWCYENEQQMQQIRSLVIEETVVQQLLDQAEVSTVSMSYEEAITPPQEAAPEAEEAAS